MQTRQLTEDEFKATMTSKMHSKVDRLMASYAEQCPAYQSVKGCIDCSWDAEVEEE